MLQAARIALRCESDPTVKEKTKKWREENADKVKEYSRKHYRNGGRQRGIDAYRENPEKRLATNAKWAADNPEKIAQIRSRRRAYKYGTRASASCPRLQAVYIIARFLRDHGHDAVVDHIVPLARGGTDTWDNLQVLTARENARKGAKLDYAVAPGGKFLTVRDIMP